MTRMWMLGPQYLCDQHLLGEHNELHKLAGSIDAGQSLDGYLDQRIVNPRRIGERHDELAAAMADRGMNHDSPLDQPDVSDYRASYVDLFAAEADLAERCADCRARLADRPCSGVSA